MAVPEPAPGLHPEYSSKRVHAPRILLSDYAALDARDKMKALFEESLAGPWGGDSYVPRFSYSGHHLALGRSGLWHALRQSHLQLSHREAFIPSVALMRSTNLSFQPGVRRALLDIVNLVLQATAVYEISGLSATATINRAELISDSGRENLSNIFIVGCCRLKFKFVVAL